MSTEKTHYCSIYNFDQLKHAIYMSNDLGERLRALREKNALSQHELAMKTGITSDYISRIELGKAKNVGIETLSIIAKALKASAGELFYHQISDKTKTQREKTIPHKLVPVVGTASCGKWKDVADASFPEEHAQEWLPVPTKDPNAFIVKAEGDSMIFDFIKEGDYLVVEPNTSIKNGNIVLAFDPNNGCTVKKYFRKRDGTILLVPANPKYEPIVVTENDERFRCYRIRRRIEEL